MMQLDLRSFNDRAEIDQAFTEVIPNPTVRRFILKNISRKEDHSFGWKINVPSLSDNLDKIFSEIKSNKKYGKPVLVVRGAKSDYVLNQDMDRIIELFPDAKLTTIANTGHWLHVEAEDVFCDQLKLFL